MQRNHDDGPYENCITIVTGDAGSGKTRLIAQVSNEFCENDTDTLCLVGSKIDEERVRKELLSTENSCNDYWNGGNIHIRGSDENMDNLPSKLSIHENVTIHHSYFNAGSEGDEIKTVDWYINYAKKFIDLGYNQVWLAIENNGKSIHVDITQYNELLSIRNVFKSGDMYFKSSVCRQYKN
jgi:hypothetical protein